MLKDKVVIITGASKGLGLSTGKIFLREGAKVVVIARDKDLLEKSWHGVSNVLTLEGDISSEKTVKDIFEKTLSHYGNIHILVNNASIPLIKKMTETTLEEWERLFSVNMTGTFLMSREAVSHMIKNNIKGKIINISSVSGDVGAPLGTAYSASKAAIIGFSKALSKEVASSGINVNCICPGAMDTDMFHKDTTGVLAEMFNADRETLLKKTINAIPLKRLLTPDEVAELILYLSSEKASGITGQTVNIDCGYAIH
ncbi:MAG TPA: SDR family oxidoreductase [Candidatus Eremiobacteraeota bacterium]|nr:MAG: Glucose 1-dehydrogenase 2 [bacterium ADurb.Bin363]HPZ07689.1 SDR family oxidoreductase [Candidatus Eremiobacteraeota bacterium]